MGDKSNFNFLCISIIVTRSDQDFHECDNVYKLRVTEENGGYVNCIVDDCLNCSIMHP